MRDEPADRFATIRQLVDDAQHAVDTMRDLTATYLDQVDIESSQQADCLQRLQQHAGEAVQNLTDAANTARHARSYQAQRHRGRDVND